MISMYAEYSGRTLYVALSSDTIEGAKNGDKLYHMDTGKRYVYNDTNNSWDEQHEEGGGGSNIMRAVFSFNEETEKLGCDKTFEEITTAIQNGDYVYGFAGVDGDNDFFYVDKTTQSFVRFSKCQIVPGTDDTGTKDYIVCDAIFVLSNNVVRATNVRHPLS